MYTKFILPISPFFPPNITALLSSTAVKVKWEHGGGLSPVVAGQLHTPVDACSESNNLWIQATHPNAKHTANIQVYNHYKVGNTKETIIPSGIL